MCSIVSAVHYPHTELHEFISPRVMNLVQLCVVSKAIMSERLEREHQVLPWADSSDVSEDEYGIQDQTNFY